MTERVVRVGTRAVIFNEDNEILVVTNLPESDYFTTNIKREEESNE